MTSSHHASLRAKKYEATTVTTEVVLLKGIFIVEKGQHDKELFEQLTIPQLCRHCIPQLTQKKKEKLHYKKLIYGK